jgi:hypothetical protein
MSTGTDKGFRGHTDPPVIVMEAEHVQIWLS